VGSVCKAHGNSVFILGGQTALNKTKETICDSLAQAGLQPPVVEWYGGECSESNVQKLCEKVLSCKADIIMAVGGGKALDTGKAVAATCGLPIITVPTIAATCAAVTPLSVMYNDKKEFASNFFLEDCPVGTIIDTAIIMDTPVVWLEAGIGDTLAKMYELRAAAAKMKPTSLTISAVSNGTICYDIISRYGKEACQAVQTGEVSSAYESVVDAIILGAGLSSIFGGETLRNAAAHAIYNGFTIIPATHSVAHGLIVGYGNLCLLALEGREDEEILQEMRLAVGCGIPIKLSQIASLTDAQLQAAAEAAAQAKAMACMPFAVTATMVKEAIFRVDTLTEQL
jgi:glycerol dehydrogenase